MIKEFLVGTAVFIVLYSAIAAFIAWAIWWTQ